MNLEINALNEFVQFIETNHFSVHVRICGHCILLDIANNTTKKTAWTQILGASNDFHISVNNDDMKGEPSLTTLSLLNRNEIVCFLHKFLD